MDMIAMSRIRLRVSREFIRWHCRIERLKRRQLAVGPTPTVRYPELPASIATEDRIGLSSEHEHWLVVGCGVVEILCQGFSKRDGFLGLEILVVSRQEEVDERTAVEGGFSAFFTTCDEITWWIGSWREAGRVVGRGWHVFVLEFSWEGVLVWKRDGESSLNKDVGIIWVVRAKLCA